MSRDFTPRHMQVIANPEQDWSRFPPCCGLTLGALTVCPQAVADPQTPRKCATEVQQTVERLYSDQKHR